LLHVPFLVHPVQGFLPPPGTGGGKVLDVHRVERDGQRGRRTPGRRPGGPGRKSVRVNLWWKWGPRAPGATFCSL